MRRSNLVSLLGGVLMAALLLPTVALAGSAPATSASLTPAAEATPAIDLSCALNLAVMSEAKPYVVCRWTAFSGADVRAYRIWRAVDGRPRQWIARVTPDQDLRFVDRTITPGHAYHYRVVAIGTDGSRLGSSDRATVRFMRAPERLGFNCAYVIDGDASGAKCRWAASTRPTAVRYVLFRSVDGGAREAVYRTRLNGVRAYWDKSLSAGQSVRYAVVALAPDGRVVGIGGPDVVIVPAQAAAAAQ